MSVQFANFLKVLDKNLHRQTINRVGPTKTLIPSNVDAPVIMGVMLVRPAGNVLWSTIAKQRHKDIQKRNLDHSQNEKSEECVLTMFVEFRKTSRLYC